MESATAYIERNQPKTDDSCRLHKYYMRAYELALQVFLAGIMLKELTDENTKYFQTVLTKWIEFHKDNKDFASMVHKIIKVAVSTAHFYVTSETMHNLVSIFFLLSLFITNGAAKCTDTFKCRKANNLSR